MTPATLEEQSFLTAILADYEDTLARLVFADYLDEHDRSTQAETLRAWGRFAWAYEDGYHCLDGMRHLAEVSDEERGYRWRTLPVYYEGYCTTLEAAMRCAYHVVIHSVLIPGSFVTFDTGEVETTELSPHMTITFPPAASTGCLHLHTGRIHVLPARCASR